MVRRFLFFFLCTNTIAPKSGRADFSVGIELPTNLPVTHSVELALDDLGIDFVNYYEAGDMTAPFGGFKQSGNGRDKSIHALEKYTEIKAIWINLAP